LYDFSEPETCAIAFASELAALREISWVDQSLNRTALNTYLSLGYVPNGTIYNGVMKLDYAKTLRFKVNALVQRHYFDSYTGFRTAQYSDEEGRQQTRLLVEQAVKLQLVADVPVGCFLSGGMDSSVIAAAMKGVASQTGQTMMTFSIGFDDPRYDESKY